MKSTIQKFKHSLFVFSLLSLVLNVDAQPDGAAVYQKNCSPCHGADLNGGNSASLIDGIWQFGAENRYITRNIKFGITHLGMPSFEKTLTEGQGGLLDVAIDPGYKENGWVYLAYSHVLENVTGEKRPPAMTRLERGEIKNNTWTENEIIFKGAGRVRDVSTGPEGAIYVVLNKQGTVLKLTPDK